MMTVPEHLRSVCPQCEYQNATQLKYCERCGSALLPFKAERETRKLQVMDDSEMLVAEERSMAALAPDRKVLVLHFEGTANLKIVDLPVGKTVLLGRSALSGNTDLVYDELVALDEYGGYVKGVSRSHALLRRTASSLAIVDLDSRNGTFINRRKLKAFESFVLAETDELHLGYLVMKLSLQQGASPVG